MHCVAGLFSYFGADVFKYSDYITYRAVFIFYSHVYYAAVVGLAVKLGMNLDSALAEFLFYVIGKNDVCAVYVRNLADFRPEFVFFPVHDREYRF